MLGEYIASAPLTLLVKPGGGIRPIAVGTIWRRLVSKVSAIMIGLSLNGYLDNLQFGVGVSRGGEAILHAVNRLIEDRRDDVGISMLLVDFKNAFNLVDREVMLQEVRLRCPSISRWVKFCYSNLAILYYREHTLWSSRGLVGVFPPNIDRPMQGVKLLGGPASVDFGFSSKLVMKRVAKTIVLMDVVAKIDDPQCELLLLRACAGISKLYFAIRTYLSRVFESAQCSFDVALRSSLDRIVTASGPGLDDWQWRISVDLQTKLLRHADIGGSEPSFENALYISQRLLKLHNLLFLYLLDKWLCGNLNKEITLSTGSGRFQSQPCLACSRVFAEDIYGDHVVSCTGIIDFKHRHNLVCDTLLDICYRSGISVDLTGSSPLTQTVMTGFVSGRAVIDAAQRKRVKYNTKCAAIGYGFLSFSFSSLGELEEGAGTLLKRIRKFSMTQDVGARVAVHIFNRIDFSIAKGPRTYNLSTLPFQDLVQIQKVPKNNLNVLKVLEKNLEVLKVEEKNLDESGPILLHKIATSMILSYWLSYFTFQIYHLLPPPSIIVATTKPAHHNHYKAPPLSPAISTIVANR
nr:putative reverse transcriptase domain-containing protein [Tanacetum cinerariifolium]